ncbi:NTPase, partial [Shigella flexneri]|nr:NTPase [Shigella flexneri]EJO7815757.1 NTPase [Shigella flexneri]HAZ7036277.1 NTPase [Escherichia coli]HCU2304507.1 NTPase [Escherichia coli]
KYLSENSSLLPTEENIKRQWAEMSEYHFLKGSGGIGEPTNIVKDALKVFLLQ